MIKNLASSKVMKYNRKHKLSLWFGPCKTHHVIFYILFSYGIFILWFGFQNKAQSATFGANPVCFQKRPVSSYANVAIKTSPNT